MPRLDPRGAAYLVTGIIALSFSYDLMRIPIQVSDTFTNILTVQQSPSVYATFAATARNGHYVRPMFNAQMDVLFDLAQGHYWLVYRGFHALLLAAALFLFTRALRVQTWTDFAAAMFALTVLTGLHTFRGTVREAFPINHFLEIAVSCLIALNLAQSRGGWWVDAAAALTFVVASLTIESGLLVWVVVVAAWACGMRGISRRGVVAMTMLLGAYFWVRFVYLSVGSLGLEERDLGFWLTEVKADELVRRFGADPTWFYVYNVVSSMLSVLFSDPDRGIFQTVRTWLEGRMPVRLYVAVVPSVITTALIAWVVVARLRGRARNMPVASDQFFIIFAVVLIANSVLSFAYTKHEIMSAAGAFYALAAFAAARHSIAGVRQDGPQERIVQPARADRVAKRPNIGEAARVALCLMLGALAAVWAFRSAGVHYMLQDRAFKERLEWARLDPDRLADRGYPSDARARALAAQLRRDALDMRMASPHLLPGWAGEWWRDLSLSR